MKTNESTSIKKNTSMPNVDRWAKFVKTQMSKNKRYEYLLKIKKMNQLENYML